MLVLIAKEKRDVRSCNANRVKLLEHATTIVERVLERIREIVNVGGMECNLALCLAEEQQTHCLL